MISTYFVHHYLTIELLVHNKISLFGLYLTCMYCALHGIFMQEQGGGKAGFTLITKWGTGKEPRQGLYYNITYMYTPTIWTCMTVKLCEDSFTFILRSIGG